MHDLDDEDTTPIPRYGRARYAAWILLIAIIGLLIAALTGCGPELGATPGAGKPGCQLEDFGRWAQAFEGVQGAAADVRVSLGPGCSYRSTAAQIDVNTVGANGLLLKDYDVYPGERFAIEVDARALARVGTLRVEIRDGSQAVVAYAEAPPPGGRMAPASRIESGRARVALMCQADKLTPFSCLFYDAVVTRTP